jgi:hypothetical protein
MLSFPTFHAALSALKDQECAVAVHIQQGPLGPEKQPAYYCVLGTNYGYLRTTSGDVRIWKSASGAYRVARKYRETWNQ